MTSPRLLVVQPSADDPPARLGDWLMAAGAVLDVLAPTEAVACDAFSACQGRPGAGVPQGFERPLPADLHGYQGLVCLGGGMGALDDADHPWLAGVRRLLATAVTRRTPTLAVCLGAQLLAVATGGRLVRAESGPEVGPFLVAKRDAAWRDPLFADLPFMPDVLQFHQDVIAVLPPNAELLASSTRYPNQAFRIGPVAYGLQFHIETTPDMVLDWAQDAPDLVRHARPGELTPERLVEVHRDIEETWQPFAARFVQLAGGSLTPAAPAQLPLA